MGIKPEVTSAVMATALPAEVLVTIAAVLPILESSFSIQPNHLYAVYWPLIALLSICSAIGLGFLIRTFPPKKVEGCSGRVQKSKVKILLLAVMVSGVLVMGEAKFMKEANDIPVGMSGLLAAALFGAVLSHNKRKVDLKITQWVDGLWSVAQYPMFGLTGYITLYVYKEGKKGTVYNHSTGEYDPIEQDASELVSCVGSVAIVCCGLVARVVTSFCVTHWSGMQWKERVLIALSGIPKTATLTFPFWVLWAMNVKEPYYGDVISSIMKVSGVAVFLTVPLGVIATRLSALYIAKTHPTPVTTEEPQMVKNLPNHLTDLEK